MKFKIFVRRGPYASRLVLLDVIDVEQFSDGKRYAENLQRCRWNKDTYYSAELV